MTAPRLLQVCNVGRITGGTAACAWTVTRALPEFEHTVAFLSQVTDETRSVFESAGVRVECWAAPCREAIETARPDAVILHNVAGRNRVSGSAVTLQYVHSIGIRAPADVTVCCSRWLAVQTGRCAASVLYQGVPRAPGCEAARRERGGRLVIGRICTPTQRKWPASMIGFYRRLAESFPRVEWEFVGCPELVRPQLSVACRGRATFMAAGWPARSRLWSWDALLYHNPHVTESFGRTAAESMRAGCIPIVDARGGFVEQVAEGTGFLCGTFEEFAEAVAELHAEAVRRRMSQAARNHGDCTFSIAQFRVELQRRLREAAGA